MPPKILIVEDDPATRMGLQELLQSVGFDVSAASDFPEGRRILERDQPQLLIVDLRLAGYNGLQLLHVNPRPVPTIVITGYPDDVLQADVRKMGAEYLIKPILPAELLRLIDRMLRGGARAVAPAAQPPPERRRAPRTPMTPGLFVEVNDVPARLLDASAEGVQFEIHRPPGHVVPASLHFVFPRQDVELEAELVWSVPELAGRWRAGAAIRRASPGWSRILRSAEH